jgi:hypothetical protein
MQSTELYQLSQQTTSGEYHDGPGVSNSGLKIFRDDVRLYHHQYVLGNRQQERKDYFDFGSAVHEVALLGDDSNIVVISEDVLSSDGSKRGKAWKQFEAENAGKLLLKPHERDAVMACVGSIKQHPIASKFLSCEGPAECAFYAKDQSLELTLKCKPDKLAVTKRGVVIVDLKTTESVNPSSFARSITQYEYDHQQVFYERVLEMCGVEVIDFVFIAVSKQPPYLVNCFSIAPDDLQFARTNTENALTDLAERYRYDNWLPKSFDKIISLSLPSYAKYRNEYDL